MSEKAPAQNNHDVADGETKPLLDNGTMSDRQQELEKHRRDRLCLALTLISVVCALVGALAVWKLHLAQQEHDEQVASLKAAAALKELNKRVNKQKLDIPTGCETTLILMRHCEKSGPHVEDSQGNQHCSYLGLERAHYLATLFGSDARWPMPSHLFALIPDRKGHRNFREYETLQPLSHKAAVMTELVPANELAELYLELLLTSDDFMCGKVAVVSWKHDYLPELAASLGCGPDQGCPLSFDEKDFESVWQLKYVYHPSTRFDDAMDEESDIDPYDDQTRRHLKFKKKRNPSKMWNLYATVTQMNFDPLSFSKASGDYPEGGTPSGGGWHKSVDYGGDL